MENPPPRIVSARVMGRREPGGEGFPSVCFQDSGLIWVLAVTFQNMEAKSQNVKQASKQKPH